MKLPPNTGTTHTVREFDSWQHFVNVAASFEHIGQSSHTYKAGYAWAGTDSYEEAIELARDGWGEARKDVDALVEKLESVITPTLQPAFESYFDVSGGMVDVGRFLDGEPECMVETRLVKTAKPGKVISILINGGFLSDIDPAAIKLRGAAIVGLVDSLEKMQHSTEIWLEVTGVSQTGRKVTQLVPLKQAADSLDIDTLMYAIGHPSRHRRLTFAMRYADGRTPGGKFASEPNECQERVGASLSLDVMRARDFTGIEQAEEWIIAQLSEFGLVKEEG